MDNFPLALQDHIEIYDDYLETIDYNFMFKRNVD